jgi:hypothetical protein
MLPGAAPPPGRGAPGRGAPGRGAWGRGMAGRSTGCADEKGLLPTRGMRAAGFGAAGRGPGVGPGRVGLGAGAAAAAGGCSAAGAGALAAGSGAAGGAGAGAGSGAAGFGAGLAAGALAAAFVAAAPLPDAFSGAGLPPPNDSRSRRATGASTVDDADLTNSPCSPSRARTSLLVTPSSLANSCTRALPATTSPVYEATAVVGRASGLAMTHGHRDFTVCSCSLLPVLLAGWSAHPEAFKDSMCSTNADVSGAPAMRSARTKARRRIASVAHCGTGCSHAPRPGRVPAGSTVTAYLPFPVDTATTRSSSTANSRFRQPTHVRTGPSVRRCAEAEDSRWITA